MRKGGQQFELTRKSGQWIAFNDAVAPGPADCVFKRIDCNCGLSAALSVPECVNGLAGIHDMTNMAFCCPVSFTHSYPPNAPLWPCRAAP